MTGNDLENAVKAVIHQNRPLNLDIGCGPFKKAGYIGIDIKDYPGVNLVGDVFEILAYIPNFSVDTVHASHFIEHIRDSRKFISEVVRILKPGSIATIIAPHFSNPYFYSDPTHRTFFGLYTMSYYSKISRFSRRVPCYEEIPNLHLVDVSLGFRSNRPFYFRHITKILLGSLVNITNYTKEFYEENLCWIFPAYEVTYVIKNHE